MNKSIHYYKYASSLNHPKAKNNLAMIYLNNIGVEKNETKNKLYAIELLKESVKMKDPVSMYNLSHIYFFYEEEKERFDIIIDLLIKSSQHFDPSIELLSVVLMKKIQNVTQENIENELKSNQNIDYQMKF